MSFVIGFAISMGALNTIGSFISALDKKIDESLARETCAVVWFILAAVCLKA
jgi:hypothetical protein